jgi:5-hydroxyisourate hydrolase
MTLTTHVLDVAAGMPAAGILIRLDRIDGDARTLVATAATNADGRTDAPLAAALEAGTYELSFAVAAYFAAREQASFYDDIAIRFRTDETARRYHVPLLLAPWGYSTYRGS